MYKSKILKDWLQCLKELQNIIPHRNFITYIAPIKIKHDKNMLILLVPNKHSKEIITLYYYGIIKQLLEKTNKNIKIIIKLG